MSISQADKIDIISTDENDRIILTISDHLEWDIEGEHAVLLQDKINAYLHFIETGQLNEEYPDAKEKKIVISLLMKHFPHYEGLAFIEECQQVVRNLGFELEWQQTNELQHPG